MKLTEGDRRLIKRSLEVLKEAAEMNPDDIIKFSTDVQSGQLGTWMQELQKTFEEGAKGAAQFQNQVTEFFTNLQEYATEQIAQQAAAEEEAERQAAAEEEAAAAEAEEAEQEASMDDEEVEDMEPSEAPEEGDPAEEELEEKEVPLDAFDG